MSRLPSHAQLATMCESDRWSILAVLARDLRDELDHFDAGVVVAFNGVNLPQQRTNVRRKLDRVYNAANVFGLYVGQRHTPKPRVRMTAGSHTAI